MRQRFIGQCVFEDTSEGKEVLEQDFSRVDGFGEDVGLDDFVTEAIQELVDTAEVKPGMHQLSFVLQVDISEGSGHLETEMEWEALWSEIYSLTPDEVSEFFTSPHPEEKDPPF